MLLTSHYMDDVAALCAARHRHRQGKLTYDGTLADLVRRLRPEKRVTLRLGEGVSRGALAALEVTVVSLVRRRGGARGRRRPACDASSPRRSSKLPVVDLTIEEAPLEEVIAELFAASPKRAEAV